MTYQQQSLGIEVADHYGLRAQLGQTMEECAELMPMSTFRARAKEMADDG